MESLIVLVGGALFTIPVIAIIALVRTSALRSVLNDRYREYVDTVSDLRREISSLRRSLADLSAQLTLQDTSSPAPPPVEAVAAQFPSVSSLVEAPSSVPATAVPEPPRQIAPLPSEPPPLDLPSPPVSLVEPPPAVEPFESVLPSAARSTEFETAVSKEEVPEFLAASVSSPGLSGQTQEAPHSPAPNFIPFETKPPSQTFMDWLRATLPLEDVLGMNLFAKIGIILLVLGFALLGRVALVAMGPAGKVALIYAAATTLLGGGIWLERKERYQLIGRAGIGGGWALLFFTTYAMYHVPAMQVMGSNTLNCILLLGVSFAMVLHTLRYRSQLVTGLAFLLAFSTVALSQDTVYALAAGVILAAGIVTIALRMGWYELEVFGILASYSNHFYWLYKLSPGGMAGHPFPQFLPSAIILILYWLTFRISYVARGIRSPRDEQISTIAALINTVSLLVVMKFQSTHPELAFYALLALGALELFFGQLPATRRRRPAFIFLSVLGTLLILASVPFRFTGNNIALLWMIAAEVLLVAGIAQAEVVFRRLGLLTGAVTGLLIVYEARHILDLRQHSEAPLFQDGILLLTCSAFFYLNAHFVRRKWENLFEGIDAHLATLQSYIGAITGFIGVWAAFTQDWTALGWAVLMLGAALGTRLLKSKQLLVQAWAFAAAVAIRAALVNCRLEEPYPHHVTTRLITLPILALIFYLTASALSGPTDLKPREYLRSLTLWAGSLTLVALAWFEVAPAWVALVWLGLAVTFGLIARRIRLTDLSYQEHLLALFVSAQLLDTNLYAQRAMERYLPFLACAAIFYAVSRFCTLPGAPHKRYAAWGHTWAATILLAALAWHESSQPWLVCIWAVFALALVILDRVFEVEELPWQAHTLAALSVWRAVATNLYTLDKWHNIDLRLITVSILVIALYILARIVRIPQQLRERDAHHAYSWAGSILAAWMLWSELQPVAVAVGLAAFGLMLFEFGLIRKESQLRLQAYVALTVAFVRIFFVNLTASSLPGEGLSPRVYTVVPIALINFFVWAQLQYNKDSVSQERRSAGNVLAWFGSGCIAALLYFQISPEWIIVAWAVLVLALMIASLALDNETFFRQSALLVVGIVARSIAHNIFEGSYFTVSGWRGNFGVLSLTAGLLLTALPIAFRLRSRYVARPIASRLSRYLLLNHPEQLLFFAPVVLSSMMIAVKMNPGMITLAWGIEGVLVILLGLTVNQRSYRITGLFLLLLCVAKIVLRDAWRLAERDRYITFIVLGTALTLVSTLYNKYRDSMRRLL
jgi:hypothetical protein